MQNRLGMLLAPRKYLIFRKYQLNSHELVFQPNSYLTPVKKSQQYKRTLLSLSSHTLRSIFSLPDCVAVQHCTALRTPTSVLTTSNHCPISRAPISNSNLQQLTHLNHKKKKKNPSDQTQT